MDPSTFTREMLDRRVRTYVAADRDACLAIFDSNVPTFFAANERDEFATFLDHQADRYYVVEQSDVVVASGGWGWREHPHVALLCWGMVRRDQHRSGVGTFLLRHRLEEIARGGFEVAEVTTSKASRPFFLRAGFVDVEVMADSFGPGVDGYRMRTAVRGSARSRTIGSRR